MYQFQITIPHIEEAVMIIIFEKCVSVTNQTIRSNVYTRFVGKTNLMKNRWHTYEYFHIAHSVGIKNFLYRISSTWKDFKSLDPCRHLCVHKLFYFILNCMNLPGNTSTWLGAWIQPFRCCIIHWNISPVFNSLHVYYFRFRCT